MVTWDTRLIAEALGGELRQRKPELTTLELTHLRVGTRLKLDMATRHDALRLWCDRNDHGQLSVVGRLDFYGIESIVIDAAERRVRFAATAPHPVELEVSAEATFQVTIGTTLNGPAPAPANPVPELVQLTGRLARPNYSERTGKPFFTAGLAEYPDGAIAPTWHNLKAFGGVARAAQHLERGAVVRVSGKPQAEHYHKDGQEMTKTVILLVHIEAARPD